LLERQNEDKDKMQRWWKDKPTTKTIIMTKTRCEFACKSNKDKDKMQRWLKGKLTTKTIIMTRTRCEDAKNDISRLLINTPK